MFINIDARLIDSGIGSYLKNILPLIDSYCRVMLLGKKDVLNKAFSCSHSEIEETKSRVYSLKEQIELPMRIRASDIFWSPHYNIPLFPIKARKRVVTIHDVLHLAFFNMLSLGQKFYAKLMLNAAVRLSDKIITVSDFSKQEIIKYTGIKGNKIKVINNGVDTHLFRIIDNPYILESVKIKYKLPERFVLFVGNVKPHKNLSRLLKAFHKLSKGSFHHCLVIVGKRKGFITEDIELFKIIQDYGSLEHRIFFTGFVENNDLPAIYNLASLFVLPSFYEGFGLTPVEAMSCGCPVVVSDAASLPEICSDAAYYINPYNVASIAGGIHNVIANKRLRKGLVEKGFKNVSKFNWSKSAQEHMKVFEEVLTE